MKMFRFRSPHSCRSGGERPDRMLRKLFYRPHRKHTGRLGCSAVTRWGDMPKSSSRGIPFEAPACLCAWRPETIARTVACLGAPASSFSRWSLLPGCLLSYRISADAVFHSADLRECLESSMSSECAVCPPKPSSHLREVRKAVVRPNGHRRNGRSYLSHILGL